MHEGSAKTGGVSPFEDDEKGKKPVESRNSPDQRLAPSFSKRNNFKNQFKPKGGGFGGKGRENFSKKSGRSERPDREKKPTWTRDKSPRDESPRSEPKFVQKDKFARANSPQVEPELTQKDGSVEAKEPIRTEAEPANFPSFDMADTVHANVPHEEAEHRYEKTEDKSKDELKSEQNLPKGTEPESSIPGVVEEGKPFVAPSFPGAPTPLEERALDSKPLDEMVVAPETKDKEKDDSKMIEDKETDEEVKASADNDYGEPKDPPYREINFEEGAARQYEQKDPLTSFPREEMAGAVPEGQLGTLGQDSQVEVADVTDSASDTVDEKTGFWEMLEDAGISRKHVYMLFGVVGAVIIIILFFVFGGYKLFTGGGEEPSVEPAPPTVEPETEVEPEGEPALVPGSEADTKEFSVPSVYDQAFGLSGLVNSYIFGLEFSKQKVLPGLNLNPIGGGGSMVGIEGAVAIGQGQGAAKEAIVYYIDLLRKIDNARQVDVYEYLNKYVDRRAALQDYLALLNTLLLEADSSKNTILQELTRIDAEYVATEDEKNAYEVSFFDAMNGFNGEKSHDYLQLFIEAGQKRVKQKAEYNALRALSESLDASVSVLAPRIQDLSINAEALIKGVKVFEVQGSNIDAIILQQ